VRVENKGFTESQRGWAYLEAVAGDAAGAAVAGGAAGAAAEAGEEAAHGGEGSYGECAVGAGRRRRGLRVWGVVRDPGERLVEIERVEEGEDRGKEI
jgi:hypothetical protein